MTQSICLSFLTLTEHQMMKSVAVEEKRIVVTKDDDFVYSFFVQAQPGRLLLVSTGNISNNELLDLFRGQLRNILNAFSEHDFVELTRDSILLHE